MKVGQLLVSLMGPNIAVVEYVMIKPFARHKFFLLIKGANPDCLAICRDAVHVHHDCLLRLKRSVRRTVSQGSHDQVLNHLSSD